jgi:DNA ligase-1
MNFVDVLKECESANGAGSKKAIQSALAKLDADGRKLMRYAMDPYTTFGVKKFDRPAIYTDPVMEPKDHTPFFSMLNKLASRELTGNAARAAVMLGLAAYSKDTAEYLERVIDQDPRAGFSADTFNKVWPTDPIPSWDQQLAEKCEDEDEFEKYVTFPCQADIKYDGTRQFAFVKDGMVEYRARGGKPSDHLNGLFDEELLEIRVRYGQDFVLDGETLGTTFEQTMNAKGSDNKEAKKALTFRAFFIMPLTDWIAQKTTITNGQTRETLIHLLHGLTKIKPTEGREVKDYADMVVYCNERIDDETKQKAEREGLILKNRDAVYEWGRSYTWVKVKRFYDVDARFVSLYPGRAKTRLENTIGGATCIAFLENGTEVRFNVGSGWSDEQRADAKANPEKWLKGTHVITYQEVSKSKGKEFHSLRFCTLKQAFRDDKLVEV